MIDSGSVLTDAASAYDQGGITTTVEVLEKYKKSQLIRILDSVFIGPVMMYYAYKGKLNKTERSVLFVFGLSTILYNYNNYRKNKESEPFLKTVLNDPLTPRALLPAVSAISNGEKV